MQGPVTFTQGSVQCHKGRTLSADCLMEEPFLVAQCASDALAVMADVAGNAVDEMEVAGQLNVRCAPLSKPACTRRREANAA